MALLDFRFKGWYYKLALLPSVNCGKLLNEVTIQKLVSDESLPPQTNIQINHVRYYLPE